jgi:hypothetical protein
MRDGYAADLLFWSMSIARTARKKRPLNSSRNDRVKVSAGGRNDRDSSSSQDR